MGRGEQAHAGPQEVRAVAQPARQRLARHGQARAEAAPLGQVGLQHAQAARVHRLPEGLDAGQVLACGQRHGHARRQRLPLAPGPRGAQRFLQPAKAERREGGGVPGCGLQVPGLVGVDHEVAVAHGLAQGLQVAQIAVTSEPHLELERAKALGLLRRSQAFGLGGVQAAGIDGHLGAHTPQQPPQRLAQPAGVQVPQGDVQPGNALGDGPGLGGLDGQHLGACAQLLESSRRRGVAAAHEQGREHAVQQAGAVLGTHGREVAPDLAPALRAFGVGDAHEHRRPVAHDAEGGLHRCVDGAAQYEGFQPGHVQHQVTRSISKWM